MVLLIVWLDSAWCVRVPGARNACVCGLWKGRLPRLQPIFAQDWGNSLISLLLPCLRWPGRRPLRLERTQNLLLRQMKLRCQCHTGCSTSRPRQIKLRWPDPPSFGPSLWLLGLHLNPRPSALTAEFDTTYARRSLWHCVQGAAEPMRCPGSIAQHLARWQV